MELLFLFVRFVFPCFFLCVIDFHEEHPHHLLNALRIAVNTSVHAHDILQSFDNIINHYAICL